MVGSDLPSSLRLLLRMVELFIYLFILCNLFYVLKTHKEKKDCLQIQLEIWVFCSGCLLHGAQNRGSISDNLVLKVSSVTWCIYEVFD